MAAAAASSSAAASAPRAACTPATHWVGFHASAAGGVHNAVANAHACGARAFAFFTRSSRTWTCPPLAPADAARFRAACAQHGYDPAHHVLPHGTYLANLGAPVGSDVRAKSLAAVQDEMARCAQLGISSYNFHPGSSSGCAGGRAECLANVAAGISECLAAVPGVTLVLETMAGQGGTVGSTLEELRDIIALVVPAAAAAARVGVCVDTAHIHAAGYDIAAPGGWDAYVGALDATVGLRRLRGLHLNDSKVARGARVDRHWNIGKGHLGIEPFRAIMNDARVAGIPLILETPVEAEAEAAAAAAAAAAAGSGSSAAGSAAAAAAAAAPSGRSKKAQEEAAAVATYSREIALLYSLQGTARGDAVPVVQAAWVRGGGRGGAGSDDAEEEEAGEEEGGGGGSRAAPPPKAKRAAAAKPRAGKRRRDGGT